MMKSLLLLVPLALSAQVTPTPSTIFDKDAVHEIRLTFKQTDWFEQLTSIYAQYPDNTPYIEASLVWGENKFDVVGVRFKGNSSYRGATTKKKPFRIKLNEFVKGQKIDGMASFGLSNAWNDPSFVREKPYYEMAAGAGLPSPRSSFAALYINGEYWGLYVLGEIVNGDFLKSHFAKSDDGGNLYKASDPGANLAYLGENPTAYQTVFSKESNEDANDWTDLIELARVFDQTPIADLPAKLEKLIDVDSFLTALALDNATVNLDSYVGLSQNYYLYRRPSDQKWVWIPWDPSLAFGAQSEGLTVQQLKDLALEWVRSANAGGPGGGFGGGSAARPVATKLWQIPEYKARYRAIYRSIVEKQMVPEQVVARMNALRAMIRPWVEKDTQKLVTQAQFDGAMTSEASPGSPGGGIAAPAGGTPGLQPFIEGRVASIKALLDGQTILLLSATPASLFFAQTTGSPAPGAQTAAVTLNDPARNGTFTATASAPWITVSPATGALPANLQVGTNAGAMGVGAYSGSVTVTTSGASNSPLTIPVTMRVSAAPAIQANPASLTLTSTGAVPGGGVATVTQAVSVAATAAAAAFTVTISDTTCNNFLAVTPMSGVAPATLTVRATPPTGSATCSGRITIASNGLASAVVPVTVAVPGGPGGGQQPAIRAIVNSASYAAGPLAPGTILTIFGNNIGPRDLVTGPVLNGQLPTNVAGVQVLFDGVPAPMMYSRINQVGAIVPFEVAGKNQVSVQLMVNGQAAPPVQQPVGPAAPGIFTTASTGSGQASVVNQNGTVNGPNAAAAKGSVVSIYLTGAGQLTPAGRNGGLGTANQRIADAVTVTIGGQEAPVSYAGAAPGSILGLYQVNAAVPAGSASGSVPVQVKVGSASAQGGVTMYVQ